MRIAALHLVLGDVRGVQDRFGGQQIERAIHRGLFLGRDDRPGGSSGRERALNPLEETQLYGEQHGFLPLLAANVGFKVIEIDVAQAQPDAVRRVARPGHYVHRLVDILSVFFLTRFTRRPLRFFGPAGAACTLIGVVGLMIVVVQRLFLDVPLADRPALILSSLLVAVGLQVLAIGLIGELIVFINARSMRQYRVREIVEAGGEARRSKQTRLTPVGVGD